MTKPDPDKIIADNRAMHDQPGYARFYDENLGIIRNPWERHIFLSKLSDTVNRIRQTCPNPLDILDLGAGTGNLTIPLLQQNHNVTSVDLSHQMLDRLRENCRTNNIPTDRLTTICQPVDTVLSDMAKNRRQFHLVCACSFYHHLPDYLTTIKTACHLVKPGGFFFLAHEPLRKNTIDSVSHVMQWLDFKVWRIKTHASELLGRGTPDIYYNPQSLADYWDQTVGCDQNQIPLELQNAGLDTQLFPYDSKRSRMIHFLCRILRTKTLFMVIARRPES